MFLKTSKDISAFMIICYVEALFNLKNEKMCSYVQQIFTDLLRSLGVWWEGMVVEDKDAQEFVHSP